MITEHSVLSPVLKKGELAVCVAEGVLVAQHSWLAVGVHAGFPLHGADRREEFCPLPTPLWVCCSARVQHEAPCELCVLCAGHRRSSAWFIITHFFMMARDGIFLLITVRKILRSYPLTLAPIEFPFILTKSVNLPNRCLSVCKIMLFI